jgi:drug/metabolite transporter (DMT)-like permease
VKLVILPGDLYVNRFDVTLQSRALTGNGLALIGAFCAAGYLLVGRWLRIPPSPLAYITMVYGTAAVALLLGVFSVVVH